MGWRIVKWEGEREISKWEVSGRLGERQICTLLERLLSKSPTEEEIIESAKGNCKLLSRVGSDFPITYGTTPFFTAERV